MADKWNIRFLELANHIAGWSKDPSTKVGAVIVRPDKTIASVGYNGFPRGVRDYQDRYEDRSIKYPMVVHAEANAIVNAKEPLNGATLYCTLFPCSSCAGLIIQSGIEVVVTPIPTDEQLDRWGDNMKIARDMFIEGGVLVVHGE